MTRATTVLVVEDSALMRKYLREMLERAGFEVLTARNGVDALKQVELTDPDVVTLDVNMPEMDGLTCLAKIMAERPRPVVMVSSLTDRGALVTLEAMELGAVDYLPKPGGTISMNMSVIERQLVAKVRAAATAKVRVPGLATPRASSSRPARARRVATNRRAARLVLVGSSTGGPGVLPEVLAALPTSFPAPIVIAQHIPATFTAHLAKRLDSMCRLEVQELDGVAELQAGCVYLGRGDADVVIGRRGGALVGRRVPSDPDRPWHPNVDRLVESARAALRDDELVCVLLTGMGDDGAESMAEVRRGGGYTVAQSERTSVVWGMPGELVARGGADVVLDIEDIGNHLAAVVSPTAPGLPPAPAAAGRLGASSLRVATGRER